MSAPGPRGAPRRPGVVVYLYPCRIQQGWGDIAEMAQAAWALHRAGFELRYLAPPEAIHKRPDPRIVPFDPTAPGPIRFPPVRRLFAPARRGRAVVLATWWGLSARRSDLEGGPLPGPLEDAITRIVRSHGAPNVLHVSLEEFGSDQTSLSALDEGLRQAGWSAARRQRALASPQGRRQQCAYHRAFALARAAEREGVVHLSATFSPSLPAMREFPFLLPVAPFGLGGTAILRPRVWDRGTSADLARSAVIWYASPKSSVGFAPAFLSALKGRSPKVLLQVRAPPALEEKLLALPQDDVSVEVLEELSPSRWRSALDRAHLRVVSGSQSLVEVVRGGGPFLYFNGLVGKPRGPTRAFRREKLLSLVRALDGLPRAGALSRDLLDFADGRNLRSVLRRALGSEAWREAMRRALAAVVLRLTAMDGDRTLVSIVQEFARSGEAANTFAKRVRERHRARLFRVNPEAR
ncbi:MAG: hypothetical protein KGJ23_09150 [Euryarchaeota archaeon]|nr:hypothetical protein [Euryarchaeota archaeon]MDE1836771.1 hypothetical protein [Euryarchaeota archaeon]MDE1879789.1 hypothetical protein [Euryarchaeota archaeon]MDE2044755.1 hypothetical protein [Thermoplasmata archaeon]